MASADHRLLPKKPYRTYQDYRNHYGEYPKTKIKKLQPEGIIAELDVSGLRGRGGAGFPTGKKWRTLFENSCETKYVVCNAAEGEPGTFKDRYLIRHNPYGILEGIWTASQVLGAKGMYIAIKRSFQKEVTILKNAIRQMKSAGIFRGAEIKIVEGPEEYLFGEEKALLNVIEGEGPFPRPVEEPPYEVGLFATPKCGNPALVNNVQTFAHVATILRFGGQSFRELGTDDTPGTILFTLYGGIRRPGIYEKPAGIPIRNLLDEAGDGPISGRKFKAVLPGVSTGVIPLKNFSCPADFGSLQKIGSGLASAGFVVLDDSNSIPTVAQAVARFLYVESCTQCFACKEGLRRASEGLDKLLVGEKIQNLLDDILSGAKSAPQGNRCYLPVQGSLLITSLMENYPKEFQNLLKKSAKAVPPWPIPKMVDYDSKKKIFTLDKLQPLKQPDWTFGVETTTSKK